MKISSMYRSFILFRLNRVYLRIRGRKKIVLLDEDDLELHVHLICRRFAKNHLQRCAKDIVSNLRYKSFNYVNIIMDFMSHNIECTELH